MQNKKLKQKKCQQYHHRKLTRTKSTKTTSESATTFTFKQTKEMKINQTKNQSRK